VTKDGCEARAASPWARRKPKPADESDPAVVLDIQDCAHQDSDTIGRIGSDDRCRRMASINSVMATILFKQIAKLHHNWVKALQRNSPKTFKKTALDLHALAKANENMRDSQFLCEMVRMLEFAVQQIEGNEWTVERSLRCPRGRPSSKRAAGTRTWTGLTPPPSIF
jgi:hypothetical protein